MMEGPTFLQRPTTYLTTYVSATFLRLSPCISTTYSSSNEEESDEGGPTNTTTHDHQSYNSNSKPFVVLNVLWNLGFVIVSLFVLLSTFKEKPSSPLRVWIVGYALQCVLHVGFVYFEFSRRNNFGGASRVSAAEGEICDNGSFVKRLESANTIASSLWWVIGFYWIVDGGQSLLQDSPRLYWLAVVFLALDVFFMIFCVGMACIICLALLCCIPVVAIAYAMTIREGASEDEIRQLPQYIFHQSYSPMMSEDLEKKHAIEKLDLQSEDSECCICLTMYVEGAEMCTLPCNHSFHYGCISRWLRINATCPLCKFNIKAKGDALV